MPTQQSGYNQQTQQSSYGQEPLYPPQPQPPVYTTQHPPQPAFPPQQPVYAQPTYPGAVGHPAAPAYPQQYPHYPGQMAPQSPQAPPKKKRRTGLIVGSVLGGVFIVLLVVCLVVGLALRSYFQNLGALANQSKIVYQDNLKDDPANWTSSSQCVGMSDGYHVQGATICDAPPSAVAGIPLTKNGSDQAIQVTVQATQASSNSAFGIAFLIQQGPRSQLDVFQITASGKWGAYAQTTDESGQQSITPLMPPGANYLPNSAIHAGLNTTNTLKVVLELNHHFVFFVNNTQVGQADDSGSPFAGSLGLGASAATQVVYTNFLDTYV